MRRIVRAVLRRLKHAGSRTWEHWSRFWFAPADPTLLGLMRFLIGGMLLYSQFVWGLGLDAFFGPDGWQGSSLVHLLQRDQYAWSFWWLVPPAFLFKAHIVCLVILLFNMLGALTPVTSVLAYLITVSSVYRAPQANYGFDQIIAIAALYLAIGPSGRAFSLDSLWRRYRAALVDVRSGRAPAREPALPSARANLAIRLLQVHLCVIYVFACLSKLQGESWWNGLAIWQAVSNLEYQSRDLTWLAWYPWLVNLLTHATIVWEMTFWALIWKPAFRPWVLMAGVAIHVGIGAFMGMWTFGLAVIFAYVVFVPATTIHAVSHAFGEAVHRIAAILHFHPARARSPRLRALAYAFGFGEHPDQPVQTPEIPMMPVEVTPVEAMQPATNRPDKTSIPPITSVRLPDKSRATVPLSPTLLMVESRLKRQGEFQEYWLRHGFHCFIAGELHEARALLAVHPIDAVVVTSTWFGLDELAAFRESLVSASDVMPASVILLGSTRRFDERFQDQRRHRVIGGIVSLRELRKLVSDALGLSPPSALAEPRRPANGHKPAAAPASDRAPVLEPQPGSTMGQSRERVLP